MERRSRTAAGRLDIRTGDTPRARQRQACEPGEILVTTPESLFLLLGSRAAENLRWVSTLIVDEVHALAAHQAGCALGAHPGAAERDHPPRPPRIGLYATVRPPGGGRPVSLVDASTRPAIDFSVSLTVPEPTADPPAEPAGSIPGALYTREVTPRPRQSTSGRPSTPG